MKSIKRFFKKQSHSIIVKPFAGLGRNINRFYENRNHDPMSNGEATILKKLGSVSPTTIFDVGANVGDYSLLVRKYCPEAKIYCFEPVSSTVNELREKLRNLNDVTIVNKGLSDVSNKISINIYEHSVHASIYQIKGTQSKSAKEEEIEVMCGDVFMESMRIDSVDLLKLDVEGSEMAALRGFGRALSQRKIRLIQFEYGYINITTKDLLLDFHEYLGKHGYIIGKIYPKMVEFRSYSYKHEDFIGPNFVALHEKDETLIRLLGK